MSRQVAALRKQFRVALKKQGVAPRHHERLLDELVLIAMADRAEELMTRAGSKKHSVAITTERTTDGGPVKVELVRDTGGVLMQWFLAPGSHMRWVANQPGSAIVIPGIRLEGFEVSAMENP